MTRNVIVEHLKRKRSAWAEMNSDKGIFCVDEKIGAIEIPRNVIPR